MDRAAEEYQLKASDFEDETEDSPCPIMDYFIQEGSGRGVVKTMTPFSFRLFDILWDQVGVEFTTGMANCKGPGSKTTPKDALFILLSVLKDPTTWAKHGLNFNMSAQRVQRLVTRGLKVLAPIVKNLYVKEVNKDEFASNAISECTNYPYVHHISDASVLEIHRPVGSHAEVKPYFSGESFTISFYCYKNEYVSHLY